VIDLLHMDQTVAAYWRRNCPNETPRPGTNTARKLNAERARYIRERIKSGASASDARREVCEKWGVEISLQAILDVWHRRTYGSVA
jgi:transposase